MLILWQDPEAEEVHAVAVASAEVHSVVAHEVAAALEEDHLEVLTAVASVVHTVAVLSEAHTVVILEDIITIITDLISGDQDTVIMVVV